MIRPEAYEQSSSISQSDLKLMRSNIQEFYKRKIMGVVKTKEEQEADRKSYFDVGDLTDVMLLQPELKSEFFTMPNTTLGEKFKSLMDELFALVIDDLTNQDQLDTLSPDVVTYVVYVEAAAKKALYYYNPEKEKPWSRKIETIVEEVITLGKPYFEALVTANGKRVVNVVNWNTAIKCVEKIVKSNNKHVNKIVNLITAKFDDTLDEGV